MNTLNIIGSMTRKQFESALMFDKNAGFSDADTQSAKWSFDYAIAFLTKKEALSVWREQRNDFRAA